MDRPLHIGDVSDIYNMTLEKVNSKNEDPHLVAQFTCERKEVVNNTSVEGNSVGCAAFQFSNIHNVTFKGISLTVHTPNMSGVTFQYASNIHVQLNISCSLVSFYQTDIRIGVLIYEASTVVVHLSQANNCSSGLVLDNTIDTHITNTTATHNKDESGGAGIFLLSTTNATIIDTSVVSNVGSGLILNDTANINVSNINVTHNGAFGVYLLNTNGVNIINMTAMYNGLNGMTLFCTNRTYISNTNITSNDIDGVTVFNSIEIYIIKTTASHNSRYGIYLISSTNAYIYLTTATHNMNIGIYFYFSTAFTRHLIVMANGNEGVRFYNATGTSMEDVSLMHNGRNQTAMTLGGDVLSTADSTSLPAVIVLYYSSVHVARCNVTENNVSAVKAYSSNITAYGDVMISNNRAIAGTAFILVQTSILKLNEKAHIQIINNYAINTGGAFYVTSDLHYSMLSLTVRSTLVETNPCFFHTVGGRSQTRFTFVNNSAGKGGDILYGGHVLYGLDGEWNCLLSFKNISKISQNGLSLITSDPIRVCLCNGTGEPDCLIVADPTPHSIYPGQSVNISAVVVGQVFGTVTGSVYAQFLHNMATASSPQLGTGQKVQGVTQEKCNYLNYTIFSPSDLSKAVLILTTHNRRISELVTFNEYAEVVEQDMKKLYHIYDTSDLNPMKYSHYPVYITVFFLPCPTGFVLTREPPFKCDCVQLLQQLHGVKCYIQDETIGRSGLVWVGTLMNDSKTVVASEYCSFGYCKEGESKVILSDPDSQCSYNHSGTLCGGCQPGLSLALGSVQCLLCSNKYLTLLIPFALAGLAVVLFIKLLDLTISQGTINGLIFYANIVKANEYLFVHQVKTNPLTLFIAWLNLDLGVETCFFHGLTAYTKTWLQFVFPLYMWSIAGFIITLAKYSDHVAKVMGNNSVPVLATLFLLSYAKILRTIITALSYTMLYSSQGHKAVWSADGNVDYLGPKHAPLFAVAVAALLFLWLPYTLLLFLGQWLHRCNCQLMNHVLMKMKPFLDAHYGPLKGRHHYWFGALLLVIAVNLLMSALIPTNRASVANLCVSVFAIVLMYFGPVVYSNVIVGMFEISFFMNLALLCVTNSFTSSSGGDQGVAASTLIGIAFVQFLGLIIFKVFSILKRSKKIMACLHKRQPVEDDWELYEAAALLRDMESNSEQEDSDGSGSIESLPTY